MALPLFGSTLGTALASSGTRSSLPSSEMHPGVGEELVRRSLSFAEEEA